MVNEKKTYEVEQLLENMKPDQLGEFYKDNSKLMADEKKAFYYYMKDTIEEKNILLKDIYSFAGVSDSYGQQVLRMEKHTKDRDLIIRFCLAGHFSVTETNRALKLYAMKPLYAKDKRDACLIVAINNRMFDLAEVDDILTQQGFEKISKDL